MKHIKTTRPSKKEKSVITPPYCANLQCNLNIITKIIATLLQFIVSTSSYAQNNNNGLAYQHSYLSCALITSEHLTSLQLFQRGMPLKLAIESLPNISRGARKRVEYIYTMAKKDGTLNTYSDINTNFARCSTLVYKAKGIPAKDLKEYGYYFCAGENKARFELLLYLDKGFTPEKLKTMVAVKHHHLITELKQLVDSRGNLAAFDLLANNLKACLQQIE